MRDRTQTVLGDILPPEERAIESVVARYQKVAPAVTRFARTLAKNDDLRVRLGSEAASRPGEVVLDPRLFQAAYSRSAPVTPTECALASALHEVVHLAVTDFEEKRPIPEEWLPERDNEDDDSEDLDEPVSLLDALSRAGFENTVNVRGSIFAWANEDRPLEKPDGSKAEKVHPFNEFWGRLLEEDRRHP